MKLGYYIRRKGEPNSLPPVNNLESYVTDSAEKAHKALNEASVSKDNYEVMPYAYDNHAKLYVNHSSQPKDYDYGDRYGCKPPERSLKYRQRIKNK